MGQLSCPQNPVTYPHLFLEAVPPPPPPHPKTNDKKKKKSTHLSFIKKQGRASQKGAHYQVISEKNYFPHYHLFLVGQMLEIWLWERSKEELWANKEKQVVTKQYHMMFTLLHHIHQQGTVIDRGSVTPKHRLTNKPASIVNSSQENAMQIQTVSTAFINNTVANCLLIMQQT